MDLELEGVEVRELETTTSLDILTDTDREVSKQ